MTRHACHDRAPFRESQRIQDGWIESGPSRVPVMVVIPNRMSRECIYPAEANDVARRGRLGAFDPQCEGCRWKQEVPHA